MPPGQAAAPVPIQADEFSRLATLAARQAAASAALGRLPSSDRELPGAVVWEDAGSAVAVGLADLTVAVAEGTVAVTVPVWCDQLPDQEGQVVVVFEVGAPGRPVGLLAATAAQPQGDPLVVRLWGSSSSRWPGKPSWTRPRASPAARASTPTGRRSRRPR